MNYTDQQAKAMIVDIGRRMFERRYVSANDGNITIRADEHHIWVTPSGVSKGYMSEDMLLCVDETGQILAGSGKPSTELEMHLRVYRENPEVRCVVHAHPIAATCFSIARTPLDLALMTESVLGLGVVPVADYATTGSPAVAESIAPYCRDYHAVLLANHGALTWGTEPLQAYYRMESVECCAEIMLKLGFLQNHPIHLLNRSQVQELLALRKERGSAAGGMPRCAEDFSDNSPR